MLDETIEYLKALAEESRLRILLILEQAGELSVNDIAHVLEISQPKVSRHLARLRLAGWVKERRWNGFALYRVTIPPEDPHRGYLTHMAEALESDDVISGDAQRLIELLSQRAQQAAERTRRTYSPGAVAS